MKNDSIFKANDQKLKAIKNKFDLDKILVENKTLID